MATKLTTKAEDKGTYVVTATFKDEDGNAVTPNWIKWTLTDERGNVINSREDVSVSSPASSIDIILKGDDLKFSDSPKRRLIIRSEYDSSLDDDLPLNSQAEFEINDIQWIE